MIRRIYLRLPGLVLLFSLLFYALRAGAQEFKTIGYLPYYRFSTLDQVQLEKLTHVNIAFANPDMDGNLSVANRDIIPVVNTLKDHDIHINISLAGGALTEEWEDAWKHLMKQENRPSFISKIIDYLIQHELDGVDMDLEWSHVDELYSPFVLELRDSLKKYNYELTAALPGTYRYPDITDEALNAFDYINMMVYDFTGPWAPNNPGPHSSFDHAVDSANYWSAQGVLFERLTLGIPFYGYNFNDPSNVFAMSYRSIIDEDPDLLSQLDRIGEIYYNGIPTVYAKTEFATKVLGGVMIWEIGLDDFGDYSLLSAIEEAIGDNLISSVANPNLVVSSYPNPVSSFLTIASDYNIARFELYNQNGRLCALGECTQRHTTIDMTNQYPGLYHLKLFGDEQIQTLKIIKL